MLAYMSSMLACMSPMLANISFMFAYSVLAYKSSMLLALGTDHLISRGGGEGLGFFLTTSYFFLSFSTTSYFFQK